MGYMHIENLYKYPYIFAFPKVYVLEKIHGTSAHLSWNGTKLTVFAGGVSHDSFCALFDLTNMQKLMHDLATRYDFSKVTVYGEAYGGSCQKMADTYGNKLKFVAFDVQVTRKGETDPVWLNVEEASRIVSSYLDLSFVFWDLVDNKLEILNKYRDAPSVQAIINGLGRDKKAEGIVIRPLIESVDKHGQRVICKHKRDDFRETATPREVSPEKLKVIEEADAVANEWVTDMRLDHVLDKLGPVDIKSTGEVVKAMIEDIKREAEGEVVWSKDCEKKIGSATATLFKQRLKKEVAKA